MSDDFFPSVWEAFNSDSLKSIRSLFERFPDKMNIETPFGTWLHYAASKSNADIVIFFVENGIGVNTKHSESGDSALNKAATKGREDIVKLLIDRGATIDTSDSLVNPLFGAVLSGSLPIVKILLERGLDPKVSYSGEYAKNMDALAFSLERGEQEIADYLANIIATEIGVDSNELLRNAAVVVRANNAAI